MPGTTGPAPAGRPTGLALPFTGQAIQGFSGIKPVEGAPGAYWVLTDNGFGNKRNSPDALLMLHRIRPDFRSGQVAVEETIFLADPDRRIPFRIAHEGDRPPLPHRQRLRPRKHPAHRRRLLDRRGIRPLPHPRSTAPAASARWSRPPSRAGRSAAPTTRRCRCPPAPPPPPSSNSARSGGFEGLAASPDGSRLFALLEKPLLTPAGAAEGRFLRIVEFDTARAAWTGRVLRYRTEDGTTSIGDFNMIDDRRALVIERDDGEGDPSLACAAGSNPPGCFANPARLKRIYVVDLGATDAEGFVRKLGHIDLMAIRDPEGLARTRGDRAAGLPADRFGFPFFTIENVAVVDADHIIVGNDNNLPFSAGRHLTRADDNELILLRVPELLRAR